MSLYGLNSVCAKLCIISHTCAKIQITKKYQLYE